MDEIPTLNELVTFIKLRNEKKIKRLAKHWGIRIDKDLRGSHGVKLESIFKKWLENEGTAATRGDVASALLAIEEREIHNSYCINIYSLQTNERGLSSLFKNVQEENVLVETCVMQCMPLGPPRVGKTCLKKRLLQEKILPSAMSASTGIVEEKQTVLINTPSTMTLATKGTNWERIPWGSEVLHLLRKFEKAPQTLYYSLQSSDSKKTRLQQLQVIVAISISLFLYILFNDLRSDPAWLLIFAVSSLMEGIAAFSISFLVRSHFNYLIYLNFSMIILFLFFCFLMQLISYMYIIGFRFFSEFSRANVWQNKIILIFYVFFFVVQEMPKQANASNKGILIEVSFYLLLFVLIVKSFLFPSNTSISLIISQMDIIFLAGFLLLSIEIDYFWMAMTTRNSPITFFKYRANNMLALRAIAFISLYLQRGFSNDILISLVTLIETFAVSRAFNTTADSKLQIFFKATWVLSFVIMVLYYFDFLVLVFQIWTLLVYFIFTSEQRVINLNDNNEASSKIVKSAIENLSDISSLHVHNKNFAAESLKIYFTDSGGQPEFQEALPALLSGPTVFFLVFNLSKGFNAKYEVKYVDKIDESKFQSYETQFTVMDALLQCLASISCLGEVASRIRLGKKDTMIKPRVFFIGTHKDLVKNIVLKTMEEELKAAVEHTTWYENNIIQFASDDNLMFTVDNFNEDDSSFGHVRAAIQKLSCSNDYKVQLPASWLGLELALRSLDDSVISITECEHIAEEYSGINSREKLDEALWFLHNKVGSIRYYKQIPELRNVVITKPQVLFTIVTDLLVGTFPFRNDDDISKSAKAKARFREKGCFTRDEVDELGNIRETGLTVTQVIALLCYLHILAPLKIDTRGNREYFLPCALSHAPKPDENRLQSKGKVSAPPLLIGFQCGYTPKGVFSGLISYIIQNKHFGLQWSLDESCLFRDQATFIIGNTGYCLTMTYLPKYLRLEFREPHGADGKKESLIIKNSIQTSLRNGVNIVQQRLNYTCNTDIKLGFYCNHSKCINDQVHPAFLVGNNMSILTCSKQASNTIEVNDEQLDWFLKKLRFHGVLSKATQVISFIMSHKLLSMTVVISALILFVLLCFRGVEFDIHTLQKDQQLIKDIQWNHYNSQCQQDPTQTLSCELAKKFKTSMKYPNNRITPIRFPVNTSSLYSFEQLTINCSLVLIISFDKCHPKSCSKPMQEIQNSLLTYLRQCPLKNEVCWPLVHHFIGFHFFNTIDRLLETMKNEISQGLKMLFKINSMLHFYYQVINYNWFTEGNQCTNDFINAIHKEGLKVEHLQDILKYVMNTEPILAPMIILRNIDKAFPPKGHNKAMMEVLTHLSEETSDTHWLVPIVATTSDDGKWFKSTKLNGTHVREYFPTLIRPKKKIIN